LAVIVQLVLAEREVELCDRDGGDRDTRDRLGSADERLEVDRRDETVEADRGSRLTLELSGFGEGLAEHGLGWFAREAAGALLQAAAPAALGDWLTDRWARRPTGAFSRDVYRDPLYHRPSFLAILETLQLAPEDRLLDVGCGGGAFLEEALKSGCRAAGIDHS